MSDQSGNILENGKITASAPCRVDMGGTLDINTFYYPLNWLRPCTVNVALKLRTRVTLVANRNRKIRVASKGFKSAEYFLKEAPYQRHPLGLMFAIAAYFKAEGVHIIIDSASPPKSALGGSSVAAVALVAALAKASGQIEQLTSRTREKVALLAQRLEASVAGVPCGLQDQLAAAYGGVHAWYWQADPQGPNFKRKSLLQKQALKNFERHLLLAYCGITHKSKDINAKWVSEFLTGRNRSRWEEIIACTERFVSALETGDIRGAVAAMNRETAIRKKMTPEVLVGLGERLVKTAISNNCGARFTGAGGGGCIWALGDLKDIDKLKGAWEAILTDRKSARLLEAQIDTDGLRFEPQ